MKAGRIVSASHKPPSRHDVKDPLLDASFEYIQATNEIKLKKNADIYGLMAIWDDAAIKKMCLFNVLILSFGAESLVESVHNCTKHLEKGGKNDAECIAGVFLPHMRKLDQTKDKFDLFALDGASNVQTASQIVNAHFPRITTIHSSEHVVSLVFSDIARIPEIKVRFVAIFD